ncbi:MAG: MBL fold metallo-hydrolase [Spirochaetales bacterium]|nr:MBL fold metallo-hydrolase [Spirochaetales bacterium]
MEVTFLGTGTSHGIPVLTCNCDICRSDRPENKRLRSSLLVRSGNSSFIVDTTPEFRIQGLRAGINSISGVFYTHTHADHLHGIDDLRPYCSKNHLPIYGSEHDINEIKSRFPYIFGEVKQLGGGKPLIESVVLNKSLIINDIKVTPIPIKHGILDIFGYRFNDVAYITDCSFIPQESYKLLTNLKVLIIGALRYRPHSTHFSIDEAINEIKRINPKEAYLTHICHDVEHFDLINKLEIKSKKDEFIKKIKPAHDGLCLKSV